MATAALPRTAREIRLAARPEGLPERAHFAVTEAPLPEPGPAGFSCATATSRCSPGCSP